MNELIEVSNNSAIRIALANYVGECCSKCGHKFSSIEDIIKRDPTRSNKDEGGLKFACKQCYTNSEE